MTTVAFAYGWSEGPWQTKLFAKMLSDKGYKIIVNVSRADIIVAHSSGCYGGLGQYRAKQILLIGPPMWPGRTLAGSVIRKLKEDLYTSYSGRYLGWLNKILHNWWYVVTTPQASLEAFRLSPKRLPHAKKGQKVILIRNNLDSFCHPKVARFLSLDRDYKYVEMAGGHDDCWTHPARYIDLLLKPL